MNLELWEQAERLTQRMFNLKPTSGSGRGHDKGDAKSALFQAETKSCSSTAFSVNFQKLKGYRLNASKDRKLFFMHVVPVICDKIVEEESWIVCSARLFKSLLENQKEEDAD